MKKILVLIMLSAFSCQLSAVSLFAQNPEAAASEKILAQSATQGANKISLDIKGMDIMDVLKMLSSRAGFNIVVGKNVTGRVTLFLKDVDVWDAFELILLSNDLAYDQKGTIINVMTQRDYELQYGERFQDRKKAKIMQLKYARAAEISKALMQIKSNIGRIVVDEGSNTIALIDAPAKVKEMEEFVKNADIPIQTRVFELNYAPADKLTPKIQEAVTKGIGSIRMDERTNKIVITDYPDKLDEIAKIIAAFDEKAPQVLIDAQIIELTPSDKLQVGINWDYWINKYFEVKTVLPINTTGSIFVTTAGAGTPSAPGQYKGVVDILRTIGDTKILSSPRIMAINNQEAKILVGTKEAYITSTTSQTGTGPNVTSQQVNFVDVGIKLYVTPTISRDGFVMMKIRPEISSSEYKELSSESQITQVPIVTTSEAETTVAVKDGVTILIGGLKKDKREKTTKRLPFLGDIPLLGYFFGSTSDELAKSELVILLTPHIMSGETAFTDFSEARPVDGAVAKMVKGKIITERILPQEHKTLAGSSSSEDLAMTAQAAENRYYQSIIDKVKSSVSSGRSKGLSGEVDISFTVIASGHVKGEPRIISSTNPSLNEIAVENIRSASPFPPFPGELLKKEESFHIALEYK